MNQQHLDETQHTENTLYCAGCNERFPQSAGAAVCPRCGVEVEWLSRIPLAETLLIKEETARPNDGSGFQLSADDQADELVGNRLHVYQCESLLGSGGMGRVYLAHHTDLHRKCALKVLSPRISRLDVDYVSRFQHEGRATAALIHPNIVTIHAIGETDGTHFLEMEFIPGRSLQRLIDAEGRLTPIRATQFAVAMADGLAAAHRAGIVHRDLKPDNVLLTHQGIPKIADFGLAKRIASDDSLPTEHLVGTPNFMSPELFNGDPATPSSDVYALGVTYFLMLTGRLPFSAASIRELIPIVAHDPLPNVRDLNPQVALEMAECLSLLLAKTPGNRPRDGIEAAQLLRAAAGQVRDLDSLLTEAFLDRTNITWTRAASRFQLEMTLHDGRSQALYIEPSDHSASDRLLLIFSICCKALPEYYEEALRLNSEMSHGSLAIRDIDGESHFVMVDTYPRSTVDVEEIRRSVMEVAFRADTVEKLLTGLDHH